MKKIVLLGSTGSIGTQTLRCCENLGYQVAALAANRNVKRLEEQARHFLPSAVAVSDEQAYRSLKVSLADTGTRILFGMEGLCELAALEGSDILCNAVVGMVGLEPTLAAIRAKKTVALSNKETLVAGGELVMAAAREEGVPILPVDSEHSAIFQCLQGNACNTPKRILLTASGGPFRGKKAAELEDVSVADALKHPNWSMGAKITVDSATLMNKGLELIEAMRLFSLRPEQIEVVVHPQSVVHSAVEYADGSVIAQMGTPDMAIPIQYALTYPHRKPTSARPLSLFEYGSLTFERPDMETFTCLKYCRQAAEKGGLYPCAVNGANEQAVALFLDGGIPFGQIGRCVGHVLEQMDGKLPAEGRYTLSQVLDTDKAARELVLDFCGRTAKM